MKKILVVSTVKGIAGRNCLTGIFDYINARLDWNIQFTQDPEEISPDILLASIRDGIDGIIVSFNERNATYDRLMDLPVPIVQIHRPDGAAGRNRAFSLLQNDDRAVGVLAARHLRSKGAFRSYAFIPTESPTAWSARRLAGFRDELRRHGIAVREPGETGLADFLKAVPRPAAVFCATDLVAANAIATCKKLKLQVPSQIAVLGVDDDELICGSSRPTLSSVHTDDFGLGRQAAAELARLMRRKNAPASEAKPVPPTAVTERESTGVIPPAGHLIEAALAFIRTNYGSGIEVRDIARHLGVSESLLRFRFRTIHGRSVRDELLDVRLDAARKLMEGGSEPLARIAARCGFSSLCRFSHFFKERTGLAPAAWRTLTRARGSGRG